MNRAYIASDAARTLTADNALEHPYDQLERLYFMQVISLYNVINLSFGTSAERLASLVSQAHDLSTYLDMRSESGLTTAVCVRTLIEAGASFFSPG